MTGGAFTAETLAWRVAMRSHLLFLLLAAVVLASSLEAVADAELAPGWRSLFLPVAVLGSVSNFLAYAWFALLARAVLLAVSPEARSAWHGAEGRREGQLARAMERGTPVFFYYLLALALMKMLSGAADLWSLGAAAPFRTASGAIVHGASEVVYAAALFFLAWTLALARNRPEAA